MLGKIGVMYSWEPLKSVGSQKSCDRLLPKTLSRKSTVQKVTVQKVTVQKVTVQNITDAIAVKLQ
jgi:hypothetical protein